MIFSHETFRQYYKNIRLIFWSTRNWNSHNKTRPSFNFKKVVWRHYSGEMKKHYNHTVNYILGDTNDGQ